MATGRPVAKILIKYDGNNLEENDEEKNELIDVELTEQKYLLEMMKIRLTLNDQMYKKKTRKILSDYLHWELAKSSRWGRFSKKVTW